MVRRVFLPFLLLAGLVLASAAADPAPEETITSRYTGRTYEVRLDAATGDKVLRGADGRTYADLRVLYDTELAEIGGPKARIDPALWSLVDADDARHRRLILVLADQPLQRIGGEPPAGGEENVRAWRTWVVAETARRAAASRAPVLERLKGVRVVGTSDLLNAIFVVVAPADLPGLLTSNPEIWCAQPAEVRQTSLDVSVPTTSAKSFWDANYDGTGITVGVIDTGMDNQHPALKAAISQEKVFLANGSSYSNFNDDATTTDDLHGHGTHCGGIVASQDSTYAGVAPGASLVNAKAGYLNTSSTGSLDDYDIIDATHWTSDKVDVLSLSFGGGAGGSGTSALAKLYDAAVHGLGIHVAVAAGNSGSNASTVLSPGDAFNVVTAGALNDKGTTSTSDDALASFSSRGPTGDGRRKPTISAPGYNIYSASQIWETAANFKNASGTSMACPHVAGALALLMDYNGSWKPQSLKALLVNSSLTGSPYPTSPDNNWGWGGMDLGQAYTDRGGVLEGTLTSSGAASVYYIRSTSLASGDRATLVWNRQITFPTSGTPGTPPSLLDLDLYLYDGSTGAEDVKSVSTVNPVEQVKSTDAVSTPVLRVKRSGTFPTGTNGFTSQPYAVAAPAGFSIATPATFTMTISAPVDPIGPGDSFTVTVTVDNTGDLPAITPTLTLTVPTGFSLTSGSASTALTTIDASGSKEVEFTVTAPSTSSAGTFAASVESTGFGATAEGGPVNAAVAVDATAPTGSVLIEGGATYSNDATVTLTLIASDAHSGVASMRVAVGTGEWSEWMDYSPSHSLEVESGDGTRSVRAQFRDRAGNVSSIVTDSIVLDTTVPVAGIVLDDGAEFTNASSVSAALSASDSGSGVFMVRSRIEGEIWGEWETLSSPKDLPLPGADGTRTVLLMVADRAGNYSEVARDSIVVDRTAPAVSVAIEEDRRSVNASRVVLDITTADNLSGVEAMQVTGAGEGPWEAPAVTKTIDLSTGEGSRTVRVRARDRAGNVSSDATDAILVDLTPPTGTFSINEGARYVLPEEPLTLAVVATDGDGGSGVVSARVRFEGDWSEEYALTAGPTIRVADLDRPAAGGYMTASLALRDEAGNVADPVDVRFAAIPKHPGPAVKKLKGTLDFPEEVESFALDLVKGDTLSVKLKDKPVAKGEIPDVGLDLVRPDGRRLVIDKFPDTLRKTGIKKYVAGETGRYFLLIYRTGGADRSLWTAKVKVKQARETKKLKGETTVLEFPAADGSTLKGVLAAEGLTAGAIRIVGPEGDVPFLFKEKAGKVTLLPTTLEAGTGTYEILVDGTGPVKHKLTCARPKS